MSGDENEEIICELDQYPIHRRPPYDALSYTWGLPGYEKRVKINGKSFFVRPNLYAFLLQRRQRKDNSFLWIDAICIDQHNVEERNFVVSLMDQIFERADTVYVWLGAEAGYTADAFDVLRQADQARQYRPLSDDGELYILEWLQTPEMKAKWPALLELCQARYWTRVWIIQEVVLASRVVLCCGRHSIGIDNVEALLSTVDVLRTRITQGLIDHTRPSEKLEWLSFGGFNFGTFDKILRETPAYKVVNFRRARRHEGLKRAKPLAWLVGQHYTGRGVLDVPTGLDQLLEKFGGAQCTDPRDGVLALLGIADDFREHKAELVDYARQPIEMFLTFAPFYLQRQGSPFAALQRLAFALKIRPKDVSSANLGTQAGACVSYDQLGLSKWPSLTYPPHAQSRGADLRRVCEIPLSPNKNREFRETQARVAEWFLERVTTVRNTPPGGSRLNPSHLCHISTAFRARTDYTVISCMKSHTTPSGTDAIFMGLTCCSVRVGDFIFEIDQNVALVLRKDDTSLFTTVGTAIVLTTHPTSFCQEFCDHACAAGLSCAMVGCAPEPPASNTIHLDPISLLTLVDAGVHSSALKDVDSKVVGRERLCEDETPVLEQYLSRSD